MKFQSINHDIIKWYRRNNFIWRLWWNATRHISTLFICSFHFIFLLQTLFSRQVASADFGDYRHSFSWYLWPSVFGTRAFVCYLPYYLIWQEFSDHCCGQQLASTPMAFRPDFALPFIQLAIGRQGHAMHRNHKQNARHVAHWPSSSPLLNSSYQPASALLMFNYAESRKWSHDRWRWRHEAAGRVRVLAILLTWRALLLSLRPYHDQPRGIVHGCRVLAVVGWHVNTAIFQAAPKATLCRSNCGHDDGCTCEIEVIFLRFGDAFCRFAHRGRRHESQLLSPAN